MTTLELQFAACACRGRLIGVSPQKRVKGVSTDTRTLRGGELFFALVGPRHDAHRHLSREVVSRLGCAVVERDRLPLPLGEFPCMVVDNTRVALRRLARAHRARCSLPIIAVTGSNGKTTTKELLASVLRPVFVTLASELSFNNDVGVPLTLLRIGSRHQVAILELGSNHPGELAPLVRMTDPKIGVLTSIGRSHLEFFGGIDGVIREKGWLAELLPEDGELFLNPEIPGADRIIRRTRASVIRVGATKACEFRMTDARFDAEGAWFRLAAREGGFNGRFRLNLLGPHQLNNAALAVAVGARLGVDAEGLRRGLESCGTPRMRLELSERDGVRMLNDAYNANPDSMRAALDTLCRLPCQGRRIAVLGAMAELGLFACAAHREVGRYAAQSGVDWLIAVGEFGQIMAQSARRAGSLKVTAVGPREGLVRELWHSFRAGDLVLVKASRAAGLDKLVTRSCAPDPLEAVEAGAS